MVDTTVILYVTLNKGGGWGWNPTSVNPVWPQIDNTPVCTKHSLSSIFIFLHYLLDWMLLPDSWTCVDGWNTTRYGIDFPIKLFFIPDFFPSHASEEEFALHIPLDIVCFSPWIKMDIREEMLQMGKTPFKKPKKNTQINLLRDRPPRYSVFFPR